MENAKSSIRSEKFNSIYSKFSAALGRVKNKIYLEGDSYKFKLCSRPEFLSYPWFLLLLTSKEEFAEMQWYLDEYKISDFMLNL